MRPVRAIGQVVSLSIVLACALIVFGTRGFLVYGNCMEPNLKTGERVLATRFAYSFGGPQRGDVVIFKYPADPSKNYVKRVIGLPGDVVEIRGGNVFVNGEPLGEPYKLYPAHGSYGPERVQPNNLFVLGDNRDESNDSRYWGELPMRNLQAKAMLLYWPLDRFHVIN